MYPSSSRVPRNPPPSSPLPRIRPPHRGRTPSTSATRPAKAARPRRSASPRHDPPASDYDETQCQRAESWMDEAVKKSPKSVALQFERRTFSASATVSRRPPRSSAPLGDRGEPAVAHNLAWVLAFEPGKGREALETINRAIALDGPKPDLLDTRAVVQLSLGQSEPAVRDLQDAIAVNPAGNIFTSAGVSPVVRPEVGRGRPGEGQGRGADGRIASPAGEGSVRTTGRRTGAQMSQTAAGGPG